VRKHKGILMERLRVLGRSGHSSDPSLGLNAIEGMMRAIDAIAAYRETLARDHADPELAVPVPTINLGRIEGGDSPNRICASCSLDVDVRLTPTLGIEAARAGLHAAVDRALAGTPFSVEHSSLVDGVPPFELESTATLVREIEAIAGAPAETVLFGTEAPFYASVGLETVVLGPGDIRVAHQPDEHTTREALSRATDLYSAIIHRFCIEGDS
jgi:acetylornithine deacetylase